jgi:hypothetical protein
MATDPITVTQEATNVGTDVSIGPGETLPDRRKNPGANPDNPGDDPGVAPSEQQPDVLGTGPSVRPPADKGGAGGGANDAS